MSAPATKLLTDSPVPYKVLREPRASYRIGQGVQETKFSVAVLAADLVDFLTFASGSEATTVDLGGGVTVTRHIPACDPDFPTLMLNDIEGTSAGGWTPTNSVTRRNWSHVKLALTFSSVPFATDGSTPFMTVDIDPTKEVVSLANVPKRFADGTPVNTDAGLLVGSAAYRITVYQATSLGDDFIFDDVCRLNDAPITLGTKVCAAGTVMMQSPRISRTYLANGQVAYQRSLAFQWREIDWNFSLRPSGVWEPAFNPGGTTLADRSYPYVDFSPLFT